MGADRSTSEPNFSIQETSQANLRRFIISITSIESAFVPLALDFNESGEYRFYDSYNLKFGPLSQEKRDSLLFSIIELKTVDSLDQNIKELYSFEEEEVRIEEQGNPDTTGDLRVYSLFYSDNEKQFLKNLYGNEEPNFDFTVPSRMPNDLQQSSIPSPIAEYDFISSLGPISGEEMTVTAVTGSATGLITTQDETITDAGGVVARARRDESGAVTTTIGVGSAATTTTVTTSGY